MTKTTQLRSHYNSLLEIDHIMTAMRNLALIEIKKVSQYITTQSKLLKTIEDVRDDFISFYPHPKPRKQEHPSLYILLGSQRGFCGSFNESIIAQFNVEAENSPLNKLDTIVVGQKLEDQLRGQASILYSIDGPSVAEDIQTSILSLTRFLEGGSIDESLANPAHWCIIYNELIDNVCVAKLLRPFSNLYETSEKAASYEPLLYLSKDQFLTQFLEHYLFSILNHIFFQSFAAENDHRFKHLTGAISRLEKKCETLKTRLNVVRQEEITEEIETILLGVE